MTNHTDSGPKKVHIETWGCQMNTADSERMLTLLAERDYVLAGGEAAVLVIAEAVGRLLPGVLGNERSALEDTFTPHADGLLEAPIFTRPASWRGREVPPVLLSGNHAVIEQWRREQARRRTVAVRPDLAPPTGT